MSHARPTLKVLSRLAHEVVVHVSQGPDGEIRLSLDSQMNYIGKYGTHIRAWDEAKIEIQQVER